MKSRFLRETRRLLCLLLLFQGQWSPATAQEPPPPNIVILISDDLGYGDLGCYGARDGLTPNLDRLAAEGVRLTNFHVPQPVCSASRAGLLTGCYPNRLGIHGALGPHARHGISPENPTLAELCRQQGYATGMAGKWHLGHLPEFLPTRHGFDTYLGLPYSNDMWPYHPEAAPGSYPPLPLIEGDRPRKVGLTADDQDQLTSLYTRHAVEFIQHHAKRPFFYYLAYSMPHVPLHVSPAFRGKSPRGLYGDVLAEIDDSVGQVMAALVEAKVDQRTLVIFLSDNGPWLSYGDHAGSAGPLREGKGTCFEGGTRVPCLMRWPDALAAASVVSDMIMSLDLFPTIAGRIGATQLPSPLDGMDVWPVIVRSPGAKNPHEAYFFWYEVNQLQAVTSGDGRWKLQLPHTYRTLAGRPGGSGGIPAAYEQRNIESPELYDLVQDIGETRDVAAEHPDVVARMLGYAAKARESLGDSLTEQR